MRKMFVLCIAILGSSFARAAEQTIALIPRLKLPSITKRFGLQVEHIGLRDDIAKDEVAKISLDKEELPELYKYLKARDMIQEQISTEGTICAGTCGGR